MDADGSGFLALSTTSATDFLSPDGTLLSQTRERLPRITGQLSGFEGDVASSDSKQTALRAWDSHGSLVAEGPLRANFQDIAEDPTGGIAVLMRATPPFVESYDTKLHLRWHVDLPLNRAFAGVAVDRAGRTLVIMDADPALTHERTAADAIWIDRDGTHGPVFRLLPPLSGFPHLIVGNMTQRVGSGLFFLADRATLQIDSLSTIARPGPDWLDLFFDFGVHMVHDGRGYAVALSKGTTTGNPCTIEVVAPSGKSCGTVSFGVCQDIAVGYDGTVIEQLGEGACGPAGCTTGWQWWTGYFH
jgi:hypothetical protein